jgi:hypothetical protein
MFWHARFLFSCLTFIFIFIGPQWLSYGPEEISIPDDFQVGLSSFAQYGGHASIQIRYDSSSTALLYRQGEAAPGDNIAFLQGKFSRMILLHQMF